MKERLRACIKKKEEKKRTRRGEAGKMERFFGWEKQGRGAIGH